MVARNFKMEEQIITLIREGLYPSRMARILKVSTTLIIRHLKRLEREGMIEAYGKCPIFYKVLRNDFKQSSAHSSLPLNDCLNSVVKQPLISNKIRLHDFKVKIPIMKHGKITLPSKKAEINNWIKEYYNVDLPTKATIEITTKSAIIHFHSTTIPRNMGFNRALVEFATKGIVAAVSYLGRSGFRMDLMNPSVISQHMAADTAKDIDKQVAEGTVFKLNLSRQATTITGNMAAEAAAWVDRSKGALEIETNDMIYEQQLLEMPIKIAKLERTAKELNDMVGSLITANDAQNKALQLLLARGK